MKFIKSWVRAFALFSFLVLGSQLYAGLPKCFVFPEVHNTNPGEFYYIVPDPDASPLPEATVITMDRAFGSEGSAYRPLTQTYYAIDEDSGTSPDLYSVNLSTGVTTLIKTNIANSEHITGAEFATDYANSEDFLYVLTEAGVKGRLHKFDPANNFDEVAGYPIDLSGPHSNDPEGLAWDPYNAKMYASTDRSSPDNSNTNQDFWEIDLATAITTAVTESDIANDGESLSFAADHFLYTEDDQSGSSSEDFIGTIDLTSGHFTQAGIVRNKVADLESMGCNAGERTDLGDAPASYGVAAHRIPVFASTPNPLYLGVNAGDDDLTSYSNANADGDDTTGVNDDDGVKMNGSTLQNGTLNAGESITFDVSANTGEGAAVAGYLQAWVDFNGDGDFNDAGEQIATNQALTTGNSGQITFTVPDDAQTGTSYVRVRYSTEQNLGPSDDVTVWLGEADNGEVEDYKITINDVPTAVDDSVITDGGTSVIAVLGNDDFGGDGAATKDIIIITPPTNGTAVVNTNGTPNDPSDDTISYTPNANFTGTDTLVYEIEDSNGDKATAVVTVTVVSPTSASDDSVSALTGDPAVIDVVGNDNSGTTTLDPTTVRIIDENGNDVTSLNVPGEGIWTVDTTTGQITFTPEPGFTGDPTPIEYHVSDNNGDPYSATVSVDYPQTAPQAVNDTKINPNPSVPSNPTTVSILTNDTDPEDDINASSVNFDPASVSGTGNDTDGDGDIDEVVVSGEGTWSVAANGVVTFTPEAGFTTDPTPITYTVKDNTSRLSNEATITIHYPAAPVAENDSQVTPVDTPVAIPVLNNDYDPDGDPLTITAVGTSTNGAAYTTPNGGTVTWDADGSMIYTPATGYVGTDTYEYTISDGNGGTDTATVTVTITDPNDPSTNTVTAIGDSATTPMDTDIDIPVLANDYDVEKDTFSINSIVTDPANGTATINSNGTVTYSPDPAFIGVDTFEYEIIDEKGAIDIAIVTVTITDPANPVPNAVADNEITNMNVPVTIDVMANDSHPNNNGEERNITSFTQPANGTVTVNDGGTPGDPSDDQFIYTPNAGFMGNDTFMYTITDANGDSATAAVTVTVEDDNFILGAQPDINTGNTPGQPVTVDILANDITGADPSTVQIVGTAQPGDPLVVPGEGTWTVDPTTGAITFTPEPGFSGDPTPIGYTVEDATGTRSAVASVTITYTSSPAPAPAPVGVNATDDTVRITHYGPTNGTLVSNDILGAGTKDEHIWALATPPSHGTVVVNPDGTYTYTPDADYNGPDSFTYTITDPQGNIATATVTVDVDCASSQTSDSGDALGTLSIIMMMFLTVMSGLYFVRKEERGEA